MIASNAKLRRIGLLAALTLMGVVPTKSHGQSAWRFVVEQRYGTHDELIGPTTLAVDGAGRLYVADTKPVAIKVFRPDGSLLRTVGRQGGGPGEFRGPWIAARGAHLIVHDPAQSRTSVFDTSGMYVRSWQSFCCHQNEISIDSSNRIMVPASTPPDPSSGTLSIRYISYARYRLDGTPIDTLRIAAPADEKLWTVARTGRDGKPSGYTSANIPFTARVLYALHPGGGFVRGWSAEYRIVRAPHGRDSSTVITRRWSPRPIPEKMRHARADSAIQLFKDMVGEGPARQAVRLQDVPRTEPAFTRLIVDEAGNVWARRLLGGDDTHSAFDVFGPTGDYLGEAILPVAVPDWGGVVFGRGVVFVSSEDADGRPIVIRFRIERMSRP